MLKGIATHLIVCQIICPVCVCVVICQCHGNQGEILFVFGHFCLHLHGLCIFRLAKCDAGLQVLKKSEQETCVAGTQVAIVNEILMDALICKYYFDVVKNRSKCDTCLHDMYVGSNTPQPQS